MLRTDTPQFRYHRVPPRDLFNEGNLLTNLGKLALQIMEHPTLHFRHNDPTEPYICAQDPNDGSTYLVNFTLYCQEHEIPLRRPLNARESWPLLAIDTQSHEALPVFDSAGNLDAPFLAWVQALAADQPHWTRPDDALP